MSDTRPIRGGYMDISGQFVRYILIGVANTAIHGTVMTVSVRFFRTNLAVANASAFLCAVTFSFIANAAWTFSTPPTAFRYLLFICFMGAMAYLTGLAGDRFKAHPAVVFIGFSVFSLAIGFMYSKFIVFAG